MTYKVYHASERYKWSVTADDSYCSVVSLEWAGPGVGGGVVFPLSVSIGLAFELLFSDVFIGIMVGRFLVHGGGAGYSEESQDDGIFHFTFFKKL